jgi:hypothetical protein
VFYHRKYIRLPDLRGIRTEMTLAYRAAVRRELEWQDLRAAIAALSAIAALDQGPALDHRLAELEARVGLKPNGEAHP